MSTSYVLNDNAGSTNFAFIIVNGPVLGTVTYSYISYLRVDSCSETELPMISTRLEHSVAGCFVGSAACMHHWLLHQASVDVVQ